MIGILTNYRQQRIHAIASHFIKSEIDDETLDLIKGATPEQKAKVKTTMDEWKHGKLKSGSKHGPEVTSQKQAVAIALNQAGLSKGVKKCMHGNIIGECEKCGDDIKKDDTSMDGADDAGMGDDVAMSIDKAFENLLSKGGPGSGRKIGSTKSGKPIYEKEAYAHADHYKNFTSKDHKDAVEILEQKNMHDEAESHHEEGKKKIKVKKSIDDEFEDLISKGGKGSNKAGRVIGHTRSGKPINVFKEAAEYKDFEAVDHLEAHKHHLNHASKVSGVKAVNSRIRAHDHEDQAKIKAAQKEAEELEQKSAENKKKTEAKGAGGKSKVAKPKSKVQKAFEDVLSKGDITSSLNSSYGSNEAMRFNKSGKEISGRLKKLKMQLEMLELDFEGHMMNLQEVIGEDPDDTNNSYNIKKLKTPRYSWNYCDNLPKSVVAESTGVVNGNMAVPPTEEEDLRKVCNQYNDFSSKLLSAKEDIESIRILIDNIESSKKYSLSVSQLGILGF